MQGRGPPLSAPYPQPMLRLRGGDEDRAAPAGARRRGVQRRAPADSDAAPKRSRRRVRGSPARSEGTSPSSSAVRRADAADTSSTQGAQDDGRGTGAGAASTGERARPGGNSAGSPSDREGSDGILAGASAGPDAADRVLEQLRDGKTPAPPLWKGSTFAGLFEQSPRVDLPGHSGMTLEHFRAERIAFDVRGNVLPPDTYRWRDRLVKIMYGESGKKAALVDVHSERQV